MQLFGPLRGQVNFQLSLLGKLLESDMEGSIGQKFISSVSTSFGRSLFLTIVLGLGGNFSNSDLRFDHTFVISLGMGGTLGYGLTPGYLLVLFYLPLRIESYMTQLCRGTLW